MSLPYSADMRPDSQQVNTDVDGSSEDYRDRDAKNGGTDNPWSAAADFDFRTNVETY